MRQGMFYGSAVALVTPFRNGSVDYPALEHLIDWQIAQRTDAVTVLGTTGEPSAVSRPERRTILDCAARHCTGKVPLIAGVSSNDTREAIDCAMEAEQAGADMILAVTPYYSRPTRSGILAHFRALADAVRIPVILYNVPRRTGISLAPETVAELAKHPNIRGLKESSNEMAHIVDLMRLVGDGFAVYAGEDANTYVMMALGAQGVISAAANVIPTMMREITNRYLRGEMDLSRAAQERALPVIRLLSRETNPICVKSALSMMGRIEEEFRLPLCPLSDEERAALHQELRALGIAGHL